MDKYIRDLTICCDNLESVVEPSFKLMQFMKMSRNSELTYPDVEVIIKACVYLQETYMIYGNRLVSKLQDHCKFYATDTFYNASLKAIQKDICEFVLRYIFDTKNGYKHILNVENVFGLLRKANLNYKLSIQKNIDTPWECIAKNRERLLLILQRLFQIPSAQIDDAIAQIIETVPFDIIAHTFLDLERHMYADLCAIFEQKICDRLENNKLPTFFINSMFYTASHSNRGSQLYWKCLKSRSFSNSLSKFFVGYLSTVVAVNNEEEQQEFRCKNVEYRKYNFAHVIFLIHSALDMRSPCRAVLYQIMHKHSIDKFVLNYLNKLEFVYD